MSDNTNRPTVAVGTSARAVRASSEPRKTSITVSTMLTVVVSMNAGDMDALRGLIAGSMPDTSHQASVRGEFLDAIDSVR